MAIDDAGRYWWHSIRLPDGRLTPGEKSVDVLEAQWRALALPPLAGRSVLDVGAWDGWFSFGAEAEGAARVVALDSFVWGRDYGQTDEYWRAVADAEARGLPRPDWGPGSRYWDTETLPGRRSFEHAHAALGSSVEAVVADVVADEVEQVGTSTSSSSSACSITCASRFAG